MRSVHSPYRRMLYMAAFHSCSLAFSLIPGSMNDLCFMSFHAFFALFSRSWNAFVVVLFRVIGCPSRFVVLVNCIPRYFTGSVLFISLISELRYPTKMVTLPQSIGSLYLDVTVSKVLSFGYISEALYVISVVSSENFNASLLLYA